MEVEERRRWPTVDSGVSVGSWRRETEGKEKRVVSDMVSSCAQAAGRFLVVEEGWEAGRL